MKSIPKIHSTHKSLTTYALIDVDISPITICKFNEPKIANDECPSANDAFFPLVLINCLLFHMGNA